MIRSRSLMLIVLGAVALGVGIWLGQSLTGQAARPPLEISGIYFPDPKDVTDFTLIQQTGKSLRPEDFKGRWSFIFFGYTHCPDVCPMTLAQMNTLEKHMAQQGQNQDTAYWLISVDPERDTPKRLGEYTAYFNEKFRGATGPHDELTKLTQQVGVYYQVQPPQEGSEDYPVDHSSAIVLLNPDAQLQAIFTHPHDDTPQTLAGDFIKIRERFQAMN